MSSRQSTGNNDRSLGKRLAHSIAVKVGMAYVSKFFRAPILLPLSLFNGCKMKMNELTLLKNLATRVQLQSSTIVDELRIYHLIPNTLEALVDAARHAFNTLVPLNGDAALFALSELISVLIEDSKPENRECDLNIKGT